eukprot:XP_001707348.1 Hypothetical protein GL50803_34403 [Giardia lamblia ATCC 50803]
MEVCKGLSTPYVIEHYTSPIGRPHEACRDQLAVESDGRNGGRARYRVRDRYSCASLILVDVKETYLRIVSR